MVEDGIKLVGFKVERVFAICALAALLVVGMPGLAFAADSLIKDKGGEIACPAPMEAHSAIEVMSIDSAVDQNNGVSAVPELAEEALLQDDAQMTTMGSSYNTDVEVSVDKSSYAVAIGQTLVVKVKITTYEPYVQGEHKYIGYLAFYSQGQWNQIASWYVDGGTIENTLSMNIQEWESTGSFTFVASVFPIDNFATGGSLCDRQFQVRILPESFTLTFDAQGGTCSPKSMQVTYNCEYGGLPVPVRDGYAFNGWYTLASGGSKVVNETIVTAMSDHTLYASWTKLIEISSCVAELSQTIYTYDGTAKMPTLVVKNGSTMLESGVDYEAIWPSNSCINAGNYTVKVIGKGDYTGAITRTFTINPKALSTCTMTLSKSSYPYDGKKKSPTVTVRDGNKELTEGSDYTLEAPTGRAAVGTYTYVATGKGNYIDSLKATLKITATWSGASKMPVKSTATYVVGSGFWIRVKDSNGKYVTSNSIVTLTAPSDTKKVVTAKKAGTTTLYLLDQDGRQVASRKITVYSIASGSYEMQSALDSDLVLDIQRKSKENSARMLVYKRNGGKNQRYQFRLQSDGAYEIVCVHSGKCVDVQGGGTSKSQAVIQYDWKGGDNQKWYITVDAGNYVTFVNAKSKMCFDIKGGKAKSGAYMIQWPSNNGKNQKWVLNKK